MTLILIISFLPAFLILYYFYKQDKNRKEPRNNIIKVFIFGSLIVIPLALILEFIIGYLLFGKFPIDVSQINSLISSFKFGFIDSALIEETLKVTIIMLLVYGLKDFDEMADGIVYTVVVGLGFAALENFLYVGTSGLAIGIFRAFTAVPMHAICGAVMGFFIGKAKFSPSKKKIWLILIGWISAVMIHGVYNISAFMSTAKPLFILVYLSIVIIGTIVSIKLMKILVAEDKKIQTLKKLETLSKISEIASAEEKDNIKTI